MEPTTFYPDRERMKPILAAAGFSCLLFVLGLLLAVGRGMHFPSPAMRWELLALGGSGLIMAGPLFVKWLRGYIRNEPTLVLDADGVHMNIGFGGVTHVPWSNIRAARIIPVKSMFRSDIQFFAIDLHDNEAVLAALPRSERITGKLSINRYNTPCLFSPAAFSVPLDAPLLAVENALYARRNQYRNRVTEGKDLLPIAATR